MEWIVVGLLGMAGAAIPEILRIVAAFKKGAKPKGLELLASAILVFLGLGVLFFDQKLGNPLQIAVTGAAFPQLFSGLVAAAKRPPAPGIRESGTRSVLEYLAWDL